MMNTNLDDDDPKKFYAGQGGEAIKELLKRVQYRRRDRKIKS